MLRALLAIAVRATIMTCYALPSHVHLCLANGHVVFLDLKEDAYSALDRTKSDAFARGLKTASDDLFGYRGPFCGTETATGAVFSELCAEGLLSALSQNQDETRRSALLATSPPTSLNLRNPARSLSHDVRGSVRLRETAAFFAACVRASLALRFERLETTVERIARRKAKAAPRAGADPERARALVATFNTLRPFYPRPYLCLFDSLALIEFLARWKHFPDWIYGVKTEPFQAHCWVQAEGCAFNEDVDVVREYAPIMAV